MTQQPNRDRPARNPGGMECEKCGAIFIGEEWHVYCAVCVDEIARAISKQQGADAEIAGTDK